MAKRKPKILKPELRRRNKPAPWIDELSGKDRKWWVAKVQSLIKRHSRPTNNPWHGTTDSSLVIRDLVKEVQRHAMPKKGPAYDGNMRMAAVLGYVLCLWYLRVHRAKSQDPRRPVKHRKAAYHSRLRFATAMFHAIVDESEDAEFFSGQKWESPFDPYPTDGYFV